MKKKNIFALKIALAVILLAATIVGLWYQTFLTIFAWIAIWKISENWQTTLAIVIPVVIGMPLAYAAAWIIHLIFTQELFMDIHSLWGMGWFCMCIYTMAIVVDEDKQQPYIWPWKQMKKLGRIVRKVQVCKIYKSAGNLLADFFKSSVLLRSPAPSQRSANEIPVPIS